MTFVSAERLVTAAHDGPGWLEIAEGIVVGRGNGSRGGLLGTVIPGFVDLHAHGAVGHDFGSTDAAGLREAIGYHASHGTTSLVASVATAPLADLNASIAFLRPFVDNGDLVGIHLEGPFLSPLRRGAHRAELLRTPRLDDIRALVNAGGDALRMLTMAPELDGAEESIRWLVERGVVVALGHSDADAKIARAAFNWGATVVTHIFNGMRPLHHREPGIIGVALLDDRVTVELILDGLHVAPEAAELVRRAAPRRLALVSDAMAATGCVDGEYDVAGSAVRVSGGVATLVGGDSLAGSTATVSTGFDLLISRGTLLSDAVDATSTSPARTLGLAVPLSVGSPADLLVVESGRVTAVMRRGTWLASS